MNKSFASDNYSGVHPEIIQAIFLANQGHAAAYGHDEYTRRAAARFREVFGPQVEVYFVYSGTGANVLGLKAALRSYQAVICSQTAHIHVDETGASENLIGCKLLPAPTRHGKIDVDGIGSLLGRRGDEHAAQPRVVSITQTTEVGTIYTLAEIQALADFAHANGLLLHMDGARIANAAVALDLPLAAFTGQAGVDILSFGGTKNGLLFGEAVVFFNPALAQDFEYIRMQGLNLHSKMRFIAAQYEALLSNDLWKRSAAQANRMAGRLADGLAGIPQVQITQPVQANVVFARLPEPAIAPLQAEYPFYVWDAAAQEVRWMCSFDTSEEDVQGFLAAIRREVGRAASA